jgi:murein DD-endopeptidase MepM/ murein hydrolase activator NlpD
MKYAFFRLMFLLVSTPTFSQNIDNEEIKEFYIAVNDALHPCISAKEYKEIEVESNLNAKSIKKYSQKKVASVSLNWPLRQANGINDCGNYVITNQVDVDNTSGIKDYNCGTRTYNGHRGTDIVPEPYPFYKMDNNQVEVIAAASGTIIAKNDGLIDKNCVTGASSYQGNYIVIQHSDGSRTLYYHMKKNSLTSKIIGQSITTGEFLGIVGSSGSSNIPHLHFEVWSSSSSSSLNDPFAGTCNTLNAASWWAVQKPYTEPEIIKLQINSIAPVLTSCPTTETSNELSDFASGGTARFYRWIRDDLPMTVSSMKILNSDGSVFDSWTAASSTSNNLAAYSNTRTLPTITGVYTYEATFNGITCAKTFTINCPDNLVLTSPTNDLSGTGIIKKAGITLLASNKISPSANVIYQSGKSITLNPATEIMKGAVFRAEIKGCN